MRVFWLWMLGWKNFMPEICLEIDQYFALTWYCNTIGQSNNAFSILGFSLGGKWRVHVLIIHWLTNTYLNNFSRSYENHSKHPGSFSYSRTPNCFSRRGFSHETTLRILLSLCRLFFTNLGPSCWMLTFTGGVGLTIKTQPSLKVPKTDQGWWGGGGGRRLESVKEIFPSLPHSPFVILELELSYLLCLSMMFAFCFDNFFP